VNHRLPARLNDVIVFLRKLYHPHYYPSHRSPSVIYRQVSVEHVKTWIQAHEFRCLIVPMNCWTPSLPPPSAPQILTASLDPGNHFVEFLSHALSAARPAHGSIMADDMCGGCVVGGIRTCGPTCARLARTLGAAAGQRSLMCNL
jgi:hypothetical protein